MCLILLTLVPIIHCFNHNHQPSYASNQQNNQTIGQNLYNHRLSGDTTTATSHATATPSNHRQAWAGAQQTTQPPAPSPQLSSQAAQRRNEPMNPYQAYQLQPVRPAKLMAEYVANQGQRLLKNLVNTTIADLVAQSTMKMNANKMSSQLNLGPTSAGSGPAGSSTIGKLYTLLFPTPSPLLAFAAPLHQLGAQHSAGSRANASTPTSSGQPPEAYNPREESKNQHYLSLSAPYDSQPRPSSGSGSGGSRSKRLRGLHPPTTDSGLEPSLVDDSWRSGSSSGRPGEASPEVGSLVSADSVFDQQQLESIGDELTESSGSSISRPEMDSTGYEQSSNSEFMHPRDDGSAARKPTPEMDLFAGPNLNPQLDDQGNLLTNFTPEIDLSQAFGRARNRKLEEEEDHQFGRPPRPSMDQLNPHGHQLLQTQESSDVNSNTDLGSAPEVAQDFMHPSMQSGRSQRQPKHYQQHKHEHHQLLREQSLEPEVARPMRHQFQEQELANQQIMIESHRDRNLSDPGLEGQYQAPEVADGSASSAAEQAALRAVFNESDSSSSTSQPDDSFFSEQLPRQYEADMRLPPEGYYDDYFKPSPVASQASLQHPASFAHHQETLSSMADFAPAAQPASGERGLDNQYESLIEEMPSMANQSSHGQVSSSAAPKKPPSYKSEIVTTEAQFNNQSSKYSQPTVGYTEQYFLNQKTMKVNSEADGRLDYANRTSQSSDKLGNLESLNYEIPSQVYEKFQGQNASLDDQYNSNNNNNQTHSMPRNLTLSSEASISTQQVRNASPNEDSIKLIIANTISSARDPRSNEKVINYTSDGFNITRGKSPRNNFVNKDMNEFPPVEVPVYQQQQQQPHPLGQVEGATGVGQVSIGQAGQRGLMPQAQPHHPPVATTSGPAILQAARQRQQQPLGHLARSSPSSLDQQHRTPAPTLQPEMDQLTTERADYKELVAQSGPGEGGEPTEEDRGPEPEGAYEQYNMRRPPEPEPEAARKSRGQPARSAPVDDQPHEQHHQEHHLSHLEQQQQPSPSESPSEANEEPSDRNDDQDRDSGTHRPRPNRKQQQQQEQRRAERKQRERRTRHKGTKYSKQHTIQRPQITQVSLNPKQLITRPPLPAASESPLEAIAEIPHKVEQLRENQPDKNELMNELLTALDRVKVAIYKLQPLTAKMNAIYRKSVTSNTRNIIMDNHKGTYAKRYPPGDYDDTYDSMRQSDPVNLQSRHSPSPRSDQSARQQQAEAADRASSQQVDGPTTAQLDANESVESAVFVPAPKEVLEKHKREISGGQPQVVTSVELDSLSALESKIVATGIGRRLGHGRISGHLRLDSGGEKLTYDDDGIEEMAPNSTLDHSSLQSFLPPLNRSTGSEEILEPLFGYRITIYRSPEAETETDPFAANQEHLVYQMEGDEREEEQPTGGGGGGGEEDSMATSESSMVGLTQQQQQQQQQQVSEDPRGPKVIVVEATGDGDQLEESESKAGKKSVGEKKKAKKSHMNKKKKQEEESKKKKEYKKIKHNKGLVSKEKKTMHRDKHIKAHDRGAAKEKALKERTQIEFFEREQIVDDEYEKGKKTTVKGGWQTGHDSKKTLKDGDNLSMGGSHFVKHEPKETDKSHSVSAEALSGKKSNKFEKKQMEAKGKKFKGWREKGYKIITETEFIDRGSLHDSAYKKRDKGAAHHHKFKKQEASSEGYHGSLLEHHKKSNKKEEKKSHEKKGEEMKKKKVKGKKKPHSGEGGGGGGGEESGPIAATAEQDDRPEEPLEHNESRQAKEPRRGQRPMLMSASSTTFRPSQIIVHSPESSQTRTLLRLLNSNVHDELTKSVLSLDEKLSNNSLIPSHNNSSAQAVSGRADPPTGSNKEQSKYQLLNYTLTNDDTNRRSDMSSTSPTTRGSKNSRSLFSSSINPLHGNSTILNIVDNLTGRQINKTKIGTYDLEDHHTVHLNHNTIGNNSSSSSSTPLIRISNGLAKYFPFLAQPNQATSLTNKPTLNQAIQTQVLLHPASFQTIPTTSPATTTSTSTTSTTTTTTTKPTSHTPNLQIKQPEMMMGHASQDVLNLHKLNNQFLNYNLAQPNSYHNNVLSRAHNNNHQVVPHPQYNQQNLGNSVRITGPTSHPVMAIAGGGGPTTRSPNFITPAQANAAAQLLHLVHRANQMTHTDPNLANHQSTNLIDLQQQLNPLQGSIPRAAFMHPPTMTNSFQHQPTQMFQPPLSYSPQPGPSFGAEHFIDYEHDPILQHHHHHHHAAAHNFLTD